MYFGLDIQKIGNGSIRQRTARTENNIGIIAKDILSYCFVCTIFYADTKFDLPNMLRIKIHDTYSVGRFGQHLQHRRLEAYLSNALDAGIILTQIRGNIGGTLLRSIVMAT